MVNATNTTETCFIPSSRIHNVLQESVKSTSNAGRANRDLTAQGVIRGEMLLPGVCSRRAQCSCGIRTVERGRNAEPQARNSDGVSRSHGADRENGRIGPGEIKGDWRRKLEDDGLRPVGRITLEPPSSVRVRVPATPPTICISTTYVLRVCGVYPC